MMPGRRTRVMVGAVQTLDQALVAVDLGADAIAFDFDRASPTHIPARDAFEILGALPPFVASVGVFTNPNLDEFCDAEEACPVASCVLAGAEGEKVVRQCGPNVIKGLRHDPLTFGAEAERWSQIEEVEGLLVTLPEVGEEALRALGSAVDNALLPVIVAGEEREQELARIVRQVRPFGVSLRPPNADFNASLARAVLAVREADALP